MSSGGKTDAENQNLSVPLKRSNLSIFPQNIPYGRKHNRVHHHHPNSVNNRHHHQVHKNSVNNATPGSGHSSVRISDLIATLGPPDCCKCGNNGDIDEPPAGMHHRQRNGSGASIQESLASETSFLKMKVSVGKITLFLCVAVSNSRILQLYLQTSVVSGKNVVFFTRIAGQRIM